MSYEVKSITEKTIIILHQWVEERSIKVGPHPWDREVEEIEYSREYSISLNRLHRLAEMANGGEFVLPRMSKDEVRATRALYDAWGNFELERELEFDLELLGQQASGELGPEDCWPGDLEYNSISVPTYRDESGPEV